MILRTIIIFLILLISFNCQAADRQCVILLHGLARTHVSMTNLQSMLQQHHYWVINEDYPSTKKSIDELANQFLPGMIDKCLKLHANQIHFVTHSLGGIILQNYLQNHTIPHLSRIVMLGPPNHGSELADLLHKNTLFKFFTGPAGQALTTPKNSAPHTIHLSHSYHIGVIAGDFSFNPIAKFIFHEASDGKVSVSSTKTSNMEDFIILPVSHTFMMSNHQVQSQVLNFLHDGKFKHAKV